MALRRSTPVAWMVRATIGFTLVLGRDASALPHVLPAEGFASSEGALVTFSGFQRGKDGDGVVFVHLTAKTGLAVKHEGTKVTVLLHGASIKGRNNLHPLDFSQFNLLILSSRLVTRGPDVELQLELRHEAHLDAQWVERPDGALSLHVLVPKL